MCQMASLRHYTRSYRRTQGDVDEFFTFVKIGAFGLNQDWSDWGMSRIRGYQTKAGTYRCQRPSQHAYTSSPLCRCAAIHRDVTPSASRSGVGSYLGVS